MNFDLVHTHDRIFDADMFTMHGVPHRTWVYDVRKKSMSLFDMATCRVESYLINNKRCRKLLPVSCMTKEKLLQNYDVEPDRIEVIHPGVDIETFEGLDREYCRREIRKEFDIGPSDIVILFVSMNFEIKGLDYVIDGIAKLKSLKPETAVKLLVVGKGNHDKFRKQAQDASAGKSIIFAGVRKEDLRNIYMASDIFMMLSRFDTFGISVLEAMAASLPVIVSGNVGAKDVIRESENGFVVDDPGNADEVCEKIAVVLDERTRSEMAREALKTALDNTWDKVADRVNSVYEELLSNGSR
jgi:UDP-glucose:(heptosyl)LPS alpha-1,3-glucosyltransferase